MRNELALGPTVVHALNILSLSDSKKFRGQFGKSLRELAPVTKNPYVCVYNGDYVLPEDLDWVPIPEDHISYIVLPMGGNGGVSQMIIGLVLVVVGAYTGNGALIAQGVAMLASGILLSNNSPLAQRAQEAPSPTYTINVSGNTARLGAAIPVPYGRHIIVPDFACQPYTEWVTPNVQYYYCLLCLGATPDVDIESLTIDDTDISHFSEVEWRLHGPNDTSINNLTLMHPNVVNLAEVADNELLRGQYVGPFAVCGPGETLVAIKYDVSVSMGLYIGNDDGSIGAKTVQWFVEVREIDEYNLPVGPWVLGGNETWTDATTTPTSRTYTVTLPAAGRYEIRLSRQDWKDTSIRAGHTLKWTGCKGFLQFAPPDPRCTYVAVRMRATNQLSGLSQRKFAAVLLRKLHTWHPETGWSENPVQTRSPAWAWTDVLRNPIYGAGVEDSRIDLQTLYELSLVWAARGDEFNMVFDKRITVWNALGIIGRVGRARPVMRGSVFTFVRDEKQTLPVALFTMRNIKKDSFKISHTFKSDDEADAIEMEYFDGITWTQKYVETPIPGVELEDVISPQGVTIPGITKESQVKRESLYMVADSKYRRSVATFATEMEGFLPTFGDLIAFSHDVTDWGSSGEIESYYGSENTIAVTEDIPWGEGNHYVLLNGPAGDVFGPYLVTPGAYARSMQFVDLPDPAVQIYWGTERERTRYAFGAANSYAKMLKVLSISPTSATEVQITAVVDDDRVYTADAGVTDSGPQGPGTIGTPGSGKTGVYAPDDVPVYESASDEQQQTYAFYSRVNGIIGPSNDPGYVYSS